MKFIIAGSCDRRFCVLHLSNMECGRAVIPTTQGSECVQILTNNTLTFVLYSADLIARNVWVVFCRTWIAQFSTHTIIYRSVCPGSTDVFNVYSVVEPPQWYHWRSHIQYWYTGNRITTHNIIVFVDYSDNDAFLHSSKTQIFAHILQYIPVPCAKPCNHVGQTWFVDEMGFINTTISLHLKTASRTACHAI